MLKILTLIAALGVAMTGELRAIGITVDQRESSMSSFVTVENSSFSAGDKLFFANILPGDFQVQTDIDYNWGPQWVGSTTADWSFEQDENQVAFSGNAQLVKTFVNGSYSTLVSTNGQMTFTLTESVNYSFASAMSGSADMDAIASVAAWIRRYPSFETVAGRSESMVGGWSNFALDITDDVGTTIIGTTTGTLDPGTYRFTWDGAIRGILAGQTETAWFSFILSSINQPPPSDGGGNHVPDAGSTLGLLCLAMSAIGLVRRMVV